MSIQATASEDQHTGRPEPTVATQRGAFETLLMLARNYPQLPAPYVVVHTAPSVPDGTVLQLEAPQDFETWREALGIDPRKVSLHCSERHAWMDADGQVGGMPIHLTGFGVPRYAVASTPELIAQRHEYADPAEPPAYSSARIPVQMTPVVTLADAAATPVQS